MWEVNKANQSDGELGVNGSSFLQPPLPALILHRRQRESKSLQWESVSAPAMGDGMQPVKEYQTVLVYLHLAALRTNERG